MSNRAILRLLSVALPVAIGLSAPARADEASDDLAAGGAAAAHVGRAEAHLALDEAKWPAPLLKMHPGQLTPEQCLEAVKKERDRTQSRIRQCAVHFHVAQLQFADGQPDDAKFSLQKALMARLTYTLEFAAAGAQPYRMTMEKIRREQAETEKT